MSRDLGGEGNGMSVTPYPPAANTAVTNSSQEKLQFDRDRKQEPLTRRTLSEKDRKLKATYTPYAHMHFDSNAQPGCSLRHISQSVILEKSFR